MKVRFCGKIRIVRDRRPGGKEPPYLVEVLDDDENERDERLERKFSTASRADKYARSLTPDSVATIPLVYADQNEPLTRWSAPLRIRTEV